MDWDIHLRKIVHVALLSFCWFLWKYALLTLEFCQNQDEWNVIMTLQEHFNTEYESYTGYKLQQCKVDCPKKKKK